MELKPIQTRTCNPPQDNLFSILDESLHNVEEQDIVIITSKVVSIHEGRCVLVDDVDKADIILDEAEYTYTIPETGRMVTITRNAVISGSGIDESNANGYYILLPKDAYKSAQEIWEYLRNRFSLNEVGVVITDSHSLPLRYGAQSISVGCWGFHPVNSHIGKKDVFGKVLQYSKTNIVDSLAAASTLVCGETSEQTPIVVARHVPDISFGDEDPRKNLLVRREEDFYGVLYKDFKKGKRTPD